MWVPWAPSWRRWGDLGELSLRFRQGRCFNFALVSATLHVVIRVREGMLTRRTLTTHPAVCEEFRWFLLDLALLQSCHGCKLCVELVVLATSARAAGHIQNQSSAKTNSPNTTWATDQTLSLTLLRDIPRTSQELPIHFLKKLALVRSVDNKTETNSPNTT